MDITELILKKLNDNLTDEQEDKLKTWLKESYMHETMMMRLGKMKGTENLFKEVKKLEPTNAWIKVIRDKDG